MDALISLITPPVSRGPTPPPERGSASAQGDNVIVPVAAHRAVGLHPSSDQKELLQKTLDEYQITFGQAFSGESVRVFSDSYEGFSCAGKVIFPEIPFLPRYFPIVPLASSYFFGVKKTAVILTGAGIAAGGVGFISGWVGRAIKLYQSKPEDNVRAKKDFLQERWEKHKEAILKANDIVMSDEGDWRRVAPEGVSLGNPKKVLAGIDDSTLVRREINNEAYVRFYEQEKGHQEAFVKELKDNKDLLAISQDPDDRPGFFSAELDYNIESEHLTKMSKRLTRAKKLIQKISGDVERSQQVSGELTPDGFRKMLNNIFKSHLIASSRLTTKQHAMLKVQEEYALVLTDQERVLSAIKEGMTPGKIETPPIGAGGNRLQASQPGRASST